MYWATDFSEFLADASDGPEVRDASDTEKGGRDVGMGGEGEGVGEGEGDEETLSLSPFLPFLGEGEKGKGRREGQGGKEGSETERGEGEKGRGRGADTHKHNVAPYLAARRRIHEHLAQSMCFETQSASELCRLYSKCVDRQTFSKVRAPVYLQ